MIRPVRTVDITDCLDRLPYNDIVPTVLQVFSIFGWCNIIFFIKTAIKTINTVIAAIKSNFNDGLNLSLTKIRVRECSDKL